MTCVGNRKQETGNGISAHPRAPVCCQLSPVGRSGGFATQRAERDARVLARVSEASAGSKAFRGFTLLEMIVAVGIFSIIMLIATGAYLTLISINRQVQATNTVVTNLAFVLENMSRNIRTGSAYCIAGCAQDSFSFKDARGVIVTYSVDGAGALARTVNAATEELTNPSHVTITRLRFYPRGYASSGGPNTTPAGDGVQPQVTIVLIGETDASGGKKASFDIQTTATSRVIDI